MKHLLLTALGLCLLSCQSFALGKDVKAKEGEKSLPSQKEEKPAIDWKSFDRKLDIKDSGITGDTAYAGALLHKDKEGKAVVTWLVAEKTKEGRWDKIYFDLNNDGKIEKTEGFERDAKLGGNANDMFMIKSLDIGGQKHTNCQVNITGDPISRGFYMNMNVGGDYKNYMRSGWHPTKSFQCKMSDKMEDAPIFDFLIVGDIEVACHKPKLPLEGKGVISMSLLVQGSTDKTVTMLGMNKIPKTDFLIELCYPTKDGNKVWSTNLNHVC